MTEFLISNEVTITNPTSEMLEYCAKKLRIDNPEFEKKMRLGFWVGNTPKKLSLYKHIEGKLVVPVGVLHDMLALADGRVITCKLADNHRVNYNAEVGLYDYQRDAVEYMAKKGYGILRSPAGSGKTQMGIALITQIGHKALWLTHTQDLLKQSYDRAKQYMSEDLLGTITEGQVNIGKGITFATVQTLARQDLEAYKYEWDIIVVDECHRVAGTPTAVTQFSRVINSLACRWKYGLSATVHRADGLIECTYALLGKVAYIVPEKAVADKIRRVKVVKVCTGATMYDEALDTDGTIIYAKLLNAIASDRGRNELIANLVIHNQEHYNLILCDRLEQMEQLAELIPGALIVTGKTKKDIREASIEAMRKGEAHTLLATYKLAKEGLDIPRLDRLYLASPQKDYAIIVQSVGRIARTFKDKEEPVCYDFVDEFGEGSWKKRVTNYKKCGCISEYWR